MPAKSLVFRDKIHRKLNLGVAVLTDAVKATMGPGGRTVVIQKKLGNPVITKDGVSVAREIELADRFANMGSRLLREAAFRSSGKSGDGTTTATVLAHAIACEGLKAVAAGLNPMDLRRGIELGADAALEHIRKAAKRVTTSDEIAQIGAIAANGDEEIGQILAKAWTAIGDDGVINVEESKSARTTVEIVDGLTFGRGYLSPYFVTDAVEQTCVLHAPHILIHEKKITDVEALLPLLEAVATAKASLLILAEDLDKAVLDALVVNHLRGGLQVAAVKMPGDGFITRSILDDIAIMTGSPVINASLGTALEHTTLEMLGRARKVTVEKSRTIIIGGNGDPQRIRDRVATLKRQMEASRAPKDRDFLQQRLAKFTGGAAIIRVGGMTKTEITERTGRIENAIAATQAATKYGIVPGGGAALLYAASALAELQPENLDQKVGIDILRRALPAPLRQIADNAGADGKIVAGRLLDEMQPSYGFDARKRECVDMMVAGIVDPARVVGMALRSAASIAGLLITTEVGIALEHGPLV